jgi:hypothetical protein
MKKLNFLFTNKGIALVMAIYLLIFVAIIVPIAAVMIKTSYNNTRTYSRFLTEAENASRAGLVDALSWFRRQPTQPVACTSPYPDAAFSPVYSTNTATSDTMDASIGIVEQYLLDSDKSLWIRYEVHKQNNPATNPTDPYAVHDITGDRVDGSSNGNGFVWQVSSIGYVYQQNNPSLQYNVSPNKIISQAAFRTEIRRITLNYINAACISDNGANVNVYDNSMVWAGSTAMGIASRTGSAPYVVSGSTVIGTPNYGLLSTTSTMSPTVSAIFGLPQSELKFMADYCVTAVNQLPTPMSTMALTYVSGDANFNASTPLSGGGILFVGGNLTVAADSNSSFNGVIYATGTVTLNDPTLVSGCVIGFAGVNISRSGAAQSVAVYYDTNKINSIKQQICQYRQDKSPFRLFGAMLN